MSAASPGDTSPQPTHIQHQKYYRRNLTAQYSMASIWGVGMAFIHGQTILPVYVSQLTDRRLAVGILAACISLGIFLPQFVGAYLVQASRKIKHFMYWAYAGMILGVVGVAASTYLTALSNTAALLAFFLMTFIVFSFNGIVQPAHLALVGKIIPPDRRGIFLGNHSFFATLTGAAAGLGATALLVRHQADFPTGYRLCYLISAVAFLLALGTFRFVREKPGPPPPPHPGVRRYFAHLRDIYRTNRAFAWFVPARMLIAVSNVLVNSLIPVFALDRFAGRITESDAGVFASAAMLGNLAGSLIFGRLGARIGYARVIVISAVIHIARLVWLLWLPEHLAYPGVIGAFFLSGLFISALILGGNSLILNFAPSNDRPTYVALTNGLRAPLLLACPVLGGWLVDEYSYELAFGISIAAAVASIAFFAWKVRDPGPGD